MNWRFNRYLSKVNLEKALTGMRWKRSLNGSWIALPIRNGREPESFAFPAVAGAWWSKVYRPSIYLT